MRPISVSVIISMLSVKVPMAQLYQGVQRIYLFRDGIQAASRHNT